MERGPSPEPTPGPSTEGSVVVDIGVATGAAVIYAPPYLDGSEIELRRAAGPWDGTHTAVRRRHLPASTCFAGVFGSLPAGRYQARLRGSDTGPVVDLDVTGGAVAELTWPTGTFDRCP